MSIKTLVYNWGNKDFGLLLSIFKKEIKLNISMNL